MAAAAAGAGAGAGASQPQDGSGAQQVSHPFPPQSPQQLLSQQSPPLQPKLRQPRLPQPKLQPRLPKSLSRRQVFLLQGSQGSPQLSHEGTPQSPHAGAASQPQVGSQAGSQAGSQHVSPQVSQQLFLLQPRSQENSLESKPQLDFLPQGSQGSQASQPLQSGAPQPAASQPQAGSEHATSHPLSQQLLALPQPLTPSIRSKRSNPKLWLQILQPRTRVIVMIIRFIGAKSPLISIRGSVRRVFEISVNHLP
jgi:hypothetical protein